MSTVKKSIDTNKTIVNTENTFKFDEKKGILTITIPVEFNKTGTVLQAKHLSQQEGKEWKFISCHDTKGNELTVYKTGFNYIPHIKESKKLSVDSKKLDTLSSEEQAILKAILSKLA